MSLRSEIGDLRKRVEALPQATSKNGRDEYGERWAHLFIRSITGNEIDGGPLSPEEEAEFQALDAAHKSDPNRGEPLKPLGRPIETVKDLVAWIDMNL